MLKPLQRCRDFVDILRRIIAATVTRNWVVQKVMPYNKNHISVEASFLSFCAEIYNEGWNWGPVLQRLFYLSLAPMEKNRNPNHFMQTAGSSNEKLKPDTMKTRSYRLFHHVIFQPIAELQLNSISGAIGDKYKFIKRNRLIKKTTPCFPSWDKKVYHAGTHFWFMKSMVHIMKVLWLNFLLNRVSCSRWLPDFLSNFIFVFQRILLIPVFCAFWVKYAQLNWIG